MRPTSALPAADEAVIDRFVHHTVAVAGRSEHTAARHRSNLRRFLFWCRRHGVDAQAVSVADIQTYLDQERMRGLSENAVAAVQSTLRPFYDHLCPDRPNPARASALPRSVPAVVPPYGPADAAAIFDRLREDRGIGGTFDLAVVATLAGTGIRTGELVRLRTDDLDLDAGVLLVRDGPTGNRSVPLPVMTEQVLESYEADVRPLCPSSDRLFANPRASFDSAGYGGLEPGLAGLIVLRAGRRSGVDGPHNWRRWRVTATVDLLRAGVPVEEVRRRLGHCNVATTARYQRFAEGLAPESGAVA